jgi:hypothetical protein
MTGKAMIYYVSIKREGIIYAEKTQKYVMMKKESIVYSS